MSFHLADPLMSHSSVCYILLRGIVLEDIPSHCCFYQSEVNGGIFPGLNEEDMP